MAGFWRIPLYLLAGVLALVAAWSMLRGSSTAAIEGTVLDEMEIGVPFARIELVSKNTSVVLVETSEEDGNFSFRDLPPGSYDLTASKPEAGNAWLEGIVLEAGQRHSVDVKLAEQYGREDDEASQAQTENLVLEDNPALLPDGEEFEVGRDPFKGPARENYIRLHPKKKKKK